MDGSGLRKVPEPNATGKMLTVVVEEPLLNKYPEEHAVKIFGVTGHSVPFHSKDSKLKSKKTKTDNAMLIVEYAKDNLRKTRVHEYTHMCGTLCGEVLKPTIHTSGDDA